MIPLTLADIAAAVRGTVCDGEPGTIVTAPVRHESARVEAGGLFAAFAGARVDGHTFAAEVIAAGAAAVLASRPVGVPAVVVDDVRDAYALLAAEVVSRLPNLHRIGVTGSSGKTSAKDLLGRVLGRLGPTVAPPGNPYVPETVLLATEETRFLIVELGARRVGDIAALMPVVRPTVGVVLGVGSAHLGTFGGRDAIVAAKGELVEALPETGLAVLNADDAAVTAMAARTGARVVTFGRHRSARVQAERVVLDGRARARFQLRTPVGTAEVALRLHGEHFVTAALAAAAVALEYTHDVWLIADALSTAAAVSPGRMRLTDRADGVTVLDDSYSADPESMAAGLRTLTALAAGRRRTVAVLGQMTELGDASAAAHREIGRTAARLGVDVVITVGGSDAQTLAAAAGPDAVHVADGEAAAERLDDVLQPGDVLLVKGSNVAELAAGYSVRSAPPSTGRVSPVR
ncbi:UDP-N-acetylmuramoyl-tripeptide--D-alanyl-D-alanine ligase [Actinoplanes friuliensis]|uniref:UDP-N-acetylmuramoyl-tripeptide--D-alanyl-D-alanine ligase n=1 Tax=Actinoplanes friuliensis DSM 7358 TaxID=1246995 RepID=U5VTY1_9ACTN|nr:UDP-N-acetylmuramoyl-tripeptide--D-alanyl-D-alanine ligase [Actinoplanes friuliensis]AGZ40458.1 UDP-N-acetylmuramoylalanyl-D-glutamyl-2, 6-diaminopimelate/D-alanyl-D-alanyl ligase [Actinoplanes friuliensis DSM 7358]